MSTPKFKPHVNRELGNQKFYSERDYRSEMKRNGLEPYDPSSVKKRENKPYVPSEWKREMMADIKNRKGAKPGERFIKELEKRGYSQKSYLKAKELAR